MRTLVITVVTGAFLALGAAPAAPPDHPVNFIKADELKALLDRGTRVDVIDVRTWDAYQEMHIKGARSMPVRALTTRANEISRVTPVVFY
jgi:rhodanese-related sulfurtransferase